MPASSGKALESSTSRTALRVSIFWPQKRPEDATAYQIGERARRVFHLARLLHRWLASGDAAGAAANVRTDPALFAMAAKCAAAKWGHVGAVQALMPREERFFNFYAAHAQMLIRAP
jgi:hypothetical protein